MKGKHSIILFVVVALGILVGTNLNGNDLGITMFSNSEVVIEPTILKEKQQKQINDFYNYVYQHLKVLDEIDATFVNVENTKVSRVELYEYFSKLVNLMEEGQHSPLGNAIPQGLSATEQETFDAIIVELYKVFQYRKFAYKNFKEYLDTNSLATLEEGKLYLSDSNSSKLDATVHLAIIQDEYNIQAEKTLLIPNNKNSSKREIL